jgi:hypothetical protein
LKEPKDRLNNRNFTSGETKLNKKLALSIAGVFGILLLTMVVIFNTSDGQEILQMMRKLHGK